MCKKNIIIFLVFGCIYSFLEVAFHAIKYFSEFGFSMIGYTSLWMFPIGGLSALLVGLINEKITIPLPIEMIVGGIIITLVEFISGSILRYLGIEIWNYYDMYFNFKGLICLEFSLLWCFLVPCIHWTDDLLREHIIINQKRV